MTSVLEPTSPAPVSMPAVCPRHPGNRVLEGCSRCGDYVCLECVNYAEGRAYCIACAPAELPLADPGARFLGRLIDNLAYAAAALIPGGIAWAAVGQELGAALGLLGFLPAWGYNVYLLATTGQSIGKSFIGTRIVTKEGGPVPVVLTLVLRTFAPLVVGFIPLVGNVFGLLDGLWVLGTQRRCLHDLMAGTIVVDAGPTEQVYARSYR
jgi:uncharacterized RDD family membrane protein YckC